MSKLDEKGIDYNECKELPKNIRDDIQIQIQIQAQAQAAEAEAEAAISI